PRLAGLLPCWLRVPTRLPSGDLPEGLLLKAAGLQGGARPAAVLDWLKYGPPLLVFCDLNAVPEPNRQPVAEALHHMQGELQSKLGRHDHRCVVAYRSVR